MSRPRKREGKWLWRFIAFRAEADRKKVLLHGSLGLLVRWRRPQACDPHVGSQVPALTLDGRFERSHHRMLPRNPRIRLFQETTWVRLESRRRMRSQTDQFQGDWMRPSSFADGFGQIGLCRLTRLDSQPRGYSDPGPFGVLVVSDGAVVTTPTDPFLFGGGLFGGLNPEDLFNAGQRRKFRSTSQRLCPCGQLGFQIQGQGLNHAAQNVQHRRHQRASLDDANLNGWPPTDYRLELFQPVLIRGGELSQAP